MCLIIFLSIFIVSENVHATDIITLTPEKVCGQNEYWNSCGSTCIPEPTCDNLNSTVATTQRLCPAVCRPKCSCIKGFVWYEGRCIKHTACPNHHADLNDCGIGGFIDKCAKACDSVPTCVFENPGPSPPHIRCTDICLEKCRCYPGYVLFEGRCIRWLDCIIHIRPPPPAHPIITTSAAADVRQWGIYPATTKIG